MLVLTSIYFRRGEGIDICWFSIRFFPPGLSFSPARPLPEWNIKFLSKPYIRCGLHNNHIHSMTAFLTLRLCTSPNSTYKLDLYCVVAWRSWTHFSPVQRLLSPFREFQCEYKTLRKLSLNALCLILVAQKFK